MTYLLFVVYNWSHLLIWLYVFDPQERTIRLLALSGLVYYGPFLFH